MRQRIRFCATPAGRVAFSVIGQGPFLLCDTGWVSHLEQMLEIESYAAFFAALAERFSVIRFDKAGSGLSDRTGGDLTFDAQVATLVAIADHLDAKRFHLFGASQGGQVAAAVAARQPERTISLIVYGMCARGRDLAPEDVRSSLVSLVRANWGLGSQLMVRIFLPDPTPDEGRVLTQFERWAATSDMARTFSLSTTERMSHHCFPRSRRPHSCYIARTIARPRSVLAARWLASYLPRS